jgi:hypothetical protein
LQNQAVQLKTQFPGSPLRAYARNRDKKLYKLCDIKVDGGPASLVFTRTTQGGRTLLIASTGSLPSAFQKKSEHVAMPGVP